MLKLPYTYRGTPIGYNQSRNSYGRRGSPRNFRLFGVIVVILLILVAILVCRLQKDPKKQKETANAPMQTEQPVVADVPVVPAPAKTETPPPVPLPKPAVQPTIPVVKPENKTATPRQMFLLAAAKKHMEKMQYDKARAKLEELVRSLPQNSYLFEDTQVLLKRISEHILLSGQTYMEYKVQSGDVLGSIARKHGVTVKALRMANNLMDNDIIKRGQILKIPAAKWSISYSKQHNKLFLFEHEKLFRIFDVVEEFPDGKKVYSGNLQEYLGEEDWIDYKKYSIPNDILVKVRR